MARRAVYWIVIGGTNVSSAFADLLLSIRVSDKVGTTSDTCSITLDDTNARVIFPQSGDPVQVYLGWEEEGVDLVFEGTIDEVRARGSKGSGRVVEISAKGFDTKGKGKEHKQKHWDDKSVKDILTDAGKSAGVSEVVVDKELGAIVRKYEAQNDESFIHFGQRLAKEIGGQFKIVGKRAILTKVGAGTSASGQPLPTVSAVWGVNLHDYDITPVIGRARHKKTRARWYDRKEGKWKEEEVEVDDDGAEATTTDRHTSPSSEEAKRRADGAAKRSKKEKGEGSVTIEGNTSAQPEGTCIVSARPGIDGPYKIDSVDHEYSRSGFITKLSLKQPDGSAGTDSRDKKASSGSGSTSGGVQEAGAVPSSPVA